MDNICATKIQSICRGKLYRINHLPNSILYIQKKLKNYIKKNNIQICNSSDDGRTNSCIDEDTIIHILQLIIGPNRIIKQKPRHWHDFKLFDYLYGWLPVNVKSTTTLNADNIGNMTTCVQSLTPYNLILDKSYKNSPMSEIILI